MATLIGCQYYYLLFLLWFLSSLTFFLDTHVMLLRMKVVLFCNRPMSPSLGIHADFPTAHMLALAFNS
ncbi:hypothetical protein PHAVU_001G138800 [Phaseolus vulgaris]|uniref:Uncharacterized protein n=1 Tax=Phaseolus vulgaris TaxID=3885 RepID=V7CYB4_PHAVU|nr:hypothetical protein PHAVU_001G138800g [Phaseolus vulgaris]ESW34275.1 hypothetical protein PHAVU_001G138800g [Phaseolus vulgaris]